MKKRELFADAVNWVRPGVPAMPREQLDSTRASEPRQRGMPLRKGTIERGGSGETVRISQGDSQRHRPRRVVAGDKNALRMDVESLARPADSIQDRLFRGCDQFGRLRPAITRASPCRAADAE